MQNNSTERSKSSPRKVKNNLDVLDEIEQQSDEDLEVKINRKFQDEQFRKRELRRKANNQLKDTDM